MTNKRIERVVLNIAAVACAAVLLLPALASRSFADSGTITIVSAAPATGVAGSSNTVVITGLSTLVPVSVSVGASYFVPSVVGSQWTVKVNTSAMANGQYAITAKATDASGHAVSATKYLVIANSPTGRSYTLSGSAVPSLATPAVAGAKTAATATLTPTVGITAPTANATLSGSYKVSGTAAETGGSVASVSVSVDGGAAAAATGTTSWSYTLNTTLHLNGTHTIAATSKDAAGHSSVAKSVTVKSSNIPTVAIAAPAVNATVSGSVNVTGSAAETGGTVQSVSVSVDGGAYAAATGAASWSHALNTATLKNGANTISVKSVDFGGNSSVIASRTITVHNVPTVTITSPAGGAKVSAAVTITGTASAETGGTLKTVLVSVDGAAGVAATGTTSWSHAVSGLKSGSHTISVTATDTAGNVSAAKSETVTVAALPTGAITSPAGGATLSGAAKVSGTAGEVGGTVASVSVSVDGGASASASGTTNWSYTLSSSLSNGAHTLTAKVTDASGNVYTTPALSFTVENNVALSGVMTVSGSNQCTTYTETSCNPGEAWNGSANVCDTKGLGICGSVKTSGSGSQAVSQTVTLTKSGSTVGQTTVAGQVTARGATSCAQYNDPTTTCVTDPIWVCEPTCVWVDDTCYDDDGNPYNCGYYDCNEQDCYWDYSNQTCTTTDNYYYTCTETVSGSGTLTGTLQ